MVNLVTTVHVNELEAIKQVLKVAPVLTPVQFEIISKGMIPL